MLRGKHLRFILFIHCRKFHPHMRSLYVSKEMYLQRCTFRDASLSNRSKIHRSNPDVSHSHTLPITSRFSPLMWP